ncbi:unnamed protein product [Urochloa humidicola]
MRHGTAAAAAVCRDSSGPPAPLPRYLCGCRLLPPAWPRRRENEPEARHWSSKDTVAAPAPVAGSSLAPSKPATAHEEEVPEFLYASGVSAAMADVAAGKSVTVTRSERQPAGATNTKRALLRVGR